MLTFLSIFPNVNVTERGVNILFAKRGTLIDFNLSSPLNRIDKGFRSGRGFTPSSASEVINFY